MKYAGYELFISRSDGAERPQRKTARAKNSTRRLLGAYVVLPVILLNLRITGFITSLPGSSINVRSVIISKALMNGNEII